MPGQFCCCAPLTNGSTLAILPLSLPFAVAVAVVVIIVFFLFIIHFACARFFLFLLLQIHDVVLYVRSNWTDTCAHHDTHYTYQTLCDFSNS